ncbi:MAG: hypothetical protein ACLGH5_10025, partial [Actinomycetes bacterium]
MRHEKGIGPELPRHAAYRAAQLLGEITGARLAAGIVDNDPGPHPLRRVEVSVERTERLLGIALDAAAVRGLLEPLGFEVADEHEAVEIEPHGFRRFDPELGHADDAAPRPRGRRPGEERHDERARGAHRVGGPLFEPAVGRRSARASCVGVSFESSVVRCRASMRA